MPREISRKSSEFHPVPTLRVPSPHPLGPPMSFPVSKAPQSHCACVGAPQATLGMAEQSLLPSGLSACRLAVSIRQLLALPCLSSSQASVSRWTASAAPAAAAARWWPLYPSSPRGQMSPPAARAGPALASSCLQREETECFLLRGALRLPRLPSPPSAAGPRFTLHDVFLLFWHGL